MKKNILKYAALVTLAWGISACTDNFDEYNTNENAPTAEQAAPDLLLTDAIEVLTDRVHSIALGHEFGACWVQYMAKAQYTDEDRYLPRVADINTAWTSLYANSGQDIAKLKKIAETTKNDSYKAVALIWGAYNASVATDLWGYVPNSAAFQGDPADGGILDPKYDDQETIYRAIIADLKEANTLLSTSTTPIAGDILFSNRLPMWRKFSNALRLRLLLRMSAKDENFAKTEMSEIAASATGANAKFPIFAAGESAALAYLGAAPNNNPIHENRKTRDDHRVSKNLVDLLKAYQDERLAVYANPAANTGIFSGIPNGLTSAAAAAYLGNGLANVSKMGSYFTAATAPGMMLSNAEQQFILAEAAKRGLIPGGDVAAETYYNAGITASFNQYATALQAKFDAGTSGDLTFPKDYTVAQAIENQIEGAHKYNPATGLQEIRVQKYIAMFDQGLQGWFEWRRTGVPALTPAANGLNDGKIPVRLTYPLDEETKNPTKVADAKRDQGGNVTLNTPVWWGTN
jgi:hypothetical protein